jgi:uncharacterized membrane protein YfcA
MFGERRPGSLAVRWVAIQALHASAFGKRAMDGTVLQLAIYLAATFVAAVVVGVSGFAFALIAAAVWLHILTPLQTATLTISYGMLVQSLGAWKLRHAVSWPRIWPFLLGGAPGVLIGVYVLHWANPSYLRAGIGVFLVLYALYGLARPTLKPVNAGRVADTGVGFISGMLGAMTGFAGILIVIWSGVRGWSRDIQRGVFAPASVALLAMCALALGATGSIARETVELFLIGLPVLLAGNWIGLKLYGRLDEEGFRRIVLTLLLLSGLPLIASLI